MKAARSGGKREIQVTRSSLPQFLDFEREAAEIWGGHRVTGFGSLSRRLENAVFHETGALAYLTSSGDMALYLTIQAVLGQNFLSRGELPEIITTPFTFLSTVGAIIRCNCRPVFADIDPVTLCLDPASVEGHITPRTRAILPVHVFGNVCDAAAFRRIADRNGLRIIYDAAHAFGEKLVWRDERGKPDCTVAHCEWKYLQERKSKSDERRKPNSVEVSWGSQLHIRSVLTLGDASCCSLNATKVFHSGEGGIAIFREREAGERFRRLTNFGLEHRENADLVGCNGKQDELRSALGLCNLRRLPESIRKRRIVAERYLARLSGVPGVTCFLSPERQRGEAEWAIRHAEVLRGGISGSGAAGREDGRRLQKREENLQKRVEILQNKGEKPQEKATCHEESCLADRGVRLIRNYGYFPILVAPEIRDRLCRELEGNGIYPRKYFYPLVSEMSVFRSLLGCDPLETPVALAASRRVLALPMYEDLPLREVDRICDIVEEVMAH